MKISYWLLVIGWWLLVGGWWLVVVGWWLVVGGWLFRECGSGEFVLKLKSVGFPRQEICMI